MGYDDGHDVFPPKKRRFMRAHYLEIEKISSSHPASSFPLQRRLVKPACAVRDEDSRYEIEKILSCLEI